MKIKHYSHVCVARNRVFVNSVDMLRSLEMEATHVMIPAALLDPQAVQ